MNALNFQHAVASERNQYCGGEASSKPEGLSSLSRGGEHRRKLVKNCGGGGWVSKTLEYTRMEAPRRRCLVYPSAVGVGSGSPEKFFCFVLRNVELYAFWTLEQVGSAATVIATMMFMTSAHHCRIDNVVLLIFYHCIIMLSRRL